MSSRRKFARYLALALVYRLSYVREVNGGTGVVWEAIRQPWKGAVTFGNATLDIYDGERLARISVNCCPVYAPAEFHRRQWTDCGRSLITVRHEEVSRAVDWLAAMIVAGEKLPSELWTPAAYAIHRPGEECPERWRLDLTTELAPVCC
ncbi:MAG: hypothetical protein ACJ8F7_23500 [Gemmataceae bacterium]